MSNYLLVHGAWHGSWCWNEVACILRKNGHKVEAPDLPGHGKDKTPIWNVTLQTCVDTICKILDTQIEPVILVGHSMGGIVTSQAAEYRPNKIKTLVYLTAFLLRSGETIEQLSYKSRPEIFKRDEHCFTVKEEWITELFYADCSPEHVICAKSLLGPEATILRKAPLELSKNNFGRIPRIYIECLRDNAIPPPIQAKMYKRTPCQKVISMETGHSPFFSAPELLAKNLMKLADC